ncbi:MAG: hypothetical protein P4L49_07060 [Desulfosporosinus sp.]|nr:hypothetical protein [Desulfosporosinus sp.]
MTIKFFDEILRETEEQGFASLPPNCVSGEGYEEWLRTDSGLQTELKEVSLHLEKIRNFFSKDIEEYKIINKIIDEYKTISYPLTIQTRTLEKLECNAEFLSNLSKNGQAINNVTWKGSSEYGRAS